MLAAAAPRCLYHLAPRCKAVRYSHYSQCHRGSAIAALGRDTTIEREASSIAAREELPVPPDEEYGLRWIKRLGTVAAAAAIFLGGLGTGLATKSVLADAPLPTLERAINVAKHEAVQAAEAAGLSAEELSTIRIFQEATPAVVNITNIRSFRSWSAMDVRKLPAGQGSGFIWDKAGHVVTNYHVIEGASEVQVTLLDQTSCAAKVVGTDVDKDIAVLQLIMPPAQLQQLQPVTLGASAKLMVGQKVYAIGNPFGLDHTLTQGIVSGLGRELNVGLFPIKDCIQTDAAINPGNSGGVLLDSAGRLIGINTAIADPSGTGSNSGVGFAIPIDTVKGLVEQILQYGRVQRPALGVVLGPPQILERVGQQGALILDVPPGSPAAAAGLQPSYRDSSGAVVLGDVIVGFNNTPITSPSELLDALDQHRVGDKVQLQLLRQGRKITVGVTLGERRRGQGSE